MAAQDGGQDSQGHGDGRLDSLERRLEQAQRTEDERLGRAAPADGNEKLGNQVLSYLLGGLLGGSLLGWLGDRWLGTGHKLLITGMVLGIVGAFWSIIKVSMRRP